jgi:hypothetical protein
MVRKVALAMVVAASVFSQSNFGNIISDYYGGVLYKGNIDRMMVINTIGYPGFFKDTSSQCGAAIRNTQLISDASILVNSERTMTYKPFPYVDQFIEPFHTGFSVSDVSAYSEFKTSMGRGGVLLSDLYGLSNKTAGNTLYNGSHEATSAQGAFWVIPKKQSRLKGISLTINSQSKDTVFQRSQNGADSYVEKSGWESNYLEGVVTSLFHLTPNQFLKISFEKSQTSCEYNTGYNRKGESYNSFNGDVWKFESSSFLLSCGLIKTNGNQATIGLAVRTNRSDYAALQNYGGFDLTNERVQNWGGKAVVFMSYSAGKTRSYLQNVLYYGFRVNVADTFLVPSGSEINSYDVLAKSRVSNQILGGCLSVPVVADINLFKSSHFFVLRLEPMLSGFYAKKEPGIKNRNLGVSINYLSLGLKGRFSDRLEYCVIPSIKTDVFFTGLELRYTFGAGKR